MTQPKIKLNALDVNSQLSLSVAGNSDVTLTTAQANNAILKFTGLLTGNINVIVPTTIQPYTVTNSTTGAFSLTVKTAAGTGVTVAQGVSVYVLSDGTNVVLVGDSDGPSLPANQIAYGTGSGITSSVDFLWNPTTNVMTVGSNVAPPTITTPNSAVSVAGITVIPGVGTGVGGANLDFSGGTGFNGGFANLDGGAANGTGGAGGNARVRGGTATNGNGGSVTIAGGDGVGADRNGGSLTLTGGDGVTGDGSGGNVTITAGTSFVGGSPAVVAITGGLGSTGPGGGVNITGGASGTSYSGGAVTIVGGTGATVGGAATIQGGTVTDGNGGPVSVTGAAGVGTNRSGGNVTITAGARTGTGTAGVINLVIPATGALHINGTAGTAGYALTSNGPAVAPTWQAITATNIAGGATNQIPYQSAASTTVFSSKLTWNNSTDALTIGPLAGTSATLTTQPGGASDDGTPLIVQAGDAPNAVAFAGDLTLRAGNGSATVSGGSVTVAAGYSAGGDGNIIFNTGNVARLQLSTSQFLSSVVMGYGTGAGGAVTQVTSRSTGVTLNKPSGAITLVSAAGSTTPTTFTVTNSQVAATDVIILSQKSGTDLYHLLVTAVAAGSFNITAFTTGGTTTEQPVINFAVKKAAIT
jgi:hypothetical protein